MINQNLLLAGDDGYNISRSLRFRASASAYLSRTFGTATDTKKWTWSAWVKRGQLGVDACIFSGGTVGGDANTFNIRFSSSDVITMSSDVTNWRITNQVYRDPSAYYHFVLAVDTTQATAANRILFYVNGVQVTSFSASNNPTQNTNIGINTVAAHYIANRTYPSALYLDSYQTDINFIDGQALTPSSFGETDAVTGVWKPKKYAGTYGTNGFYLPFSDNSSTTTLGYDKSGNSNNWTCNNISLTAGTTYDSMTDVPTLTSATASNFCVLSPLNAAVAPINGNLAIQGNASWRGCTSTFQIPSTGLYYFEISGFQISQRIVGGLALSTLGTVTSPFQTTIGFLGAAADSVNTNVMNNISVVNTILFSLTGTSSSEVFSFAINSTTGNMWFGRNGTWYNSTGSATGNPATGANPTWSGITASNYFPAVQCYDSGVNVYANFGQRPFAYTPPTGFVALNTFNLPEPSIKAGNKHFDAVTYTGNGGTLSVTNTGSFQPDLVWIKRRDSGAESHKLNDSVRGVNKQLMSNSTDDEYTNTDQLTSFNSNGFTTGASGTTNGNGNSLISWMWKAGGSAVTNTAGSITSTVSANPTAGFSVVTWTNNNTANQSIGHGLGVAPSMIITKDRDNGTFNWATWFTGFTKDEYLLLNTTGAKASYNTLWYLTPDSSKFYIGSTGTGVNYGTDRMVAYCFSEVAGYSKFGSYTGNGSADGPFVHLGFRPKFVMVKRTDGVGNWIVWDTARNTYNATDTVLYPNLSNAEGSGVPIDSLSNGFKMRDTSTSDNFSGGTYIFMAFAENPFKYSLAR